MYHSTRDKLMKLPQTVTVYPAHGPGSLCGKNLSPDLQSTIGRELRENYALQLMDELTFVKTLVADQPFIPKYFGHDVDINKKGAEPFAKSVASVPKIKHNVPLQSGMLVVDTRPQDQFKNGHVKGAINIQDGNKFETWLGSIVGPDEAFYLIAADEDSMDTLIKKAAKIGYEKNIKAALLSPTTNLEKLPEIDTEDYNFHPDHYTVVDVRNWGEINEGKIFEHSISIPLPELRERLNEIPTDKPVVVHCAAGYRSAAASSIVAGRITNVPVYDLGEAVTEVGNQKTEIGD
jgi:hydroxyacylglutathione hydrolase